MSPMVAQRVATPSVLGDVFRTRSDLNRMLDSLFSDASQSMTGWAPPVSVAETADELLITVELPGMRQDDIEVTTEGGRLTISGQKETRHWVTTGDEPTYHLDERTFGKFERSFALPRTVNPDGISARFQDGLLLISLPKAEEAKPRRVEIKSDTR